jgi:hypothetical protein
VAGLIPCGVDALRVLEHMGASWSSVFDILAGAEDGRDAEYVAIGGVVRRRRVSHGYVGGHEAEAGQLAGQDPRRRH